MGYEPVLCIFFHCFLIFHIILYAYVTGAVATHAKIIPFPFSSLILALCPVSQWDLLFRASGMMLEMVRASWGLSKANSALGSPQHMQILLILLANRQWFLHQQGFEKEMGNSVDLSHFGGNGIW